jgi:hypothetical protein
MLIRTYTVEALLLKFANGTVMDGDNMSNAEHIYSIAVKHAQTVQVCIDRLHELGANEQLKLLTGRLQELAIQATPEDDDKSTKAGQRAIGRHSNPS